MPSGNVDKPVIEDNRDGTVCIKYDPREEGLHELSVKYNGEHVQGMSSHFTLSTRSIIIQAFRRVELLACSTERKNKNTLKR